MTTFSRVRVIGRGRVGGAVAARLAERGLLGDGAEYDLAVLCVPDAAIADVARTIPAGPWVAHVSGATPLASLANIALVVGGAPLTAQMAAAGSRLAQLVVIDALVAAVALRDPQRSRRAERAGIDLPDIA